MDTIEIVKLPANQWADYRRLRLEALQNEPQAFSSTYATFVVKPDSYWQNRLSQAAASGSNWLLFARPVNPQATGGVAETTAAGQVVGMIGALRMDEEPGVAEIVSVYVTPLWRGKGVARVLMTTIIQILSQEGSFHTLRLGVSDSQTAAQKLYGSMGFQIKESVQVTLGDGLIHQEYVMERPCNLSEAAA